MKLGSAVAVRMASDATSIYQALASTNPNMAVGSTISFWISSLGNKGVYRLIYSFVSLFYHCLGTEVQACYRTVPRPSRRSSKYCDFDM